MTTEFVQSLARGLDVITAFDAEHPALTLSQVAARTGLSRATARRFLHTLVGLGHVRTDGRLFALTPKVLSLGTAYLTSLGLPALLQPHLERLSRQVGLSTSAAVLDGDDIVNVARCSTRRIMTVDISVGTRFPAYATSMGRVLLAALAPAELDEHLDRVVLRPLTERTTTDPRALRQVLDVVRGQGWAVVDQELEVGLRSAAAPVTDREGAVVAAVNLSSPATRDGLSPDHLEALVATAGAASADVASAAGPRPGRA